MPKQNGSVIAGVIGNNNGEVGLAWIDLANPVLHLGQLRDSKLYEATITALRECNASEIVFPSTHTQSALYEALVRDDKLPWIVSPRPRRVFSEDCGLDKIQKLSAVELDLRELDRRYLCRGAAAALLANVELTQDARFAQGSLRVCVDDDDHTRMTLDAVTISLLEILEDRRAVLEQHRQASMHSLVSVMDYTVTPCGGRRLRAELVAPPCLLDKIHARQDLVQELLEDETLCDLLVEHLRKLHDLDQLTSHYAARPKQFTMITLKREADNTIRLLETVRELLALDEAVGNRVGSTLGKELLGSIRNSLPILKTLEQHLAKKLQPGVGFQRNPEEQRIEVVYCVIAGIDGVLDVARQTYAEKIAAMKHYVAELNKQYADLDACLWFSVKRGYHLRVPREHATPSRLGSLLIRPAFHKKTVDCTTEELASLNLKQDQATREALRRTEVHLEDVRGKVRTALPALYAISEAIALLDILQGFAQMASEHDVVRPRVYSGKFGASSEPLELDDHGHHKSKEHVNGVNIKQGRHLLVETSLQKQQQKLQHQFQDESSSRRETRDWTFVANDLNLSSLAVVTGPNSAGKSTLLKQTALIVILAHAGAWVPAEKAEIVLINQILTRIGTEDNIEANASTFSLEMTEFAHIARAASPSSETGAYHLVLIDELGRGTSSQEGLSLAWAASEYLLRREFTLTIFATHFREIEALPGISLVRFSVEIDEVTQALVLSHTMQQQLQAHPSEMEKPEAQGFPSDYGIRLAEACGFPRHAIDDARIARELLLEHRVSLEAKRAGLYVLVRDAYMMTLPELRNALTHLQSRE